MDLLGRGVMTLSFFLCCPPKMSLFKEKSMDNLTKILMTVWMVLAIASFVCSFWAAPLLVKVIGLVFGSLNLMIIGSWAIGFVQAIREYYKTKKKE